MDPDDYGDEPATAGEIDVGEAITGAIENPGDGDWFSITLRAGITYQFELRGFDSGVGTLRDPLLYLYDAAGNFVVGDDDGGRNTESRLRFTPVTTGSYYLASYAYSGVDIGSYQLSTLALNSAAFGINSGGEFLFAGDGTPYIADDWFTAGNRSTTTAAIAGTTDDALYQSERWSASSFGYDVPVGNGRYFVTLRFAELFQNAPGRVFDVAAEGQLWLNDLDIYAEVGKFRALNFTKAVTVTDGVLDIDFIKQLKNPTINGIEIVPVGDLVVAVNAGGGAYSAIDGTFYNADTGFTGGSTAARTAPVAGTNDDFLYQNERWGPNGFDWAWDVENGRYYVTLQFAETFFGTSGVRIFDVEIEGLLRIDNLDVYAEVGGYRAYDVTLAVDVADGELNIDFLKQLGSPIVNAIRVERAYEAPPARAGLAIDVGGLGVTTLDGTLFQADAYFSGGVARSVPNAIAGTLDDALYRTERWTAGPLAYDIPVEGGDYVVTLHFAELFHNAAGKTFDVSLEGGLRIDDLDIYAEVGKFAALEISLPVSVADGILDLDFARGTRNPTLAGIEVTPVGTPIAAVNAGGIAYTASDGTVYSNDYGFSVSNVVAKSTPIAETLDDYLYQTERWAQGGFSWDSDVDNGEYFLTLSFAETFHTAAGRRLFDIRVENELRVDDYDIYAEAGGYARAVDLTLAVTVEDGHLDLDLLPLLGAPKLNALKLVPVEDGLA